MITLMQGDCLELMKSIPDQSIDMIFCDLPYGTTRLRWDIPIDLNELWEHYKRIITARGAIVLTANQPFTSRLISSNFEMFKYNWIWKKNFPTGFLNANYRPMNIYEDVCVFSHAPASPVLKQNYMTYHPQGLIEKNKKKVNRPNSRGKNIHEGTGIGVNNVLNSTNEYVQKFTNYPCNIVEFDRDMPQIHPTQKPLALVEYFVKTYSEQGGVVLDNCMGSGTTGVACVNTGRSFIGMELNEKYFYMSKDRIYGA